MIVTALPYHVIDDMWIIVEPWLERASKITDGLYAAEDIKDRLDKQEMALWLVIDDENNDVPIACYTTRIIQYPKGRGMAVDFVGGRMMGSWLDDVLSMIDKYARDSQCTHIEGGGRKGWLPALEKAGWHSVHSFRKNL